MRFFFLCLLLLFFTATLCCRSDAASSSKDEERVSQLEEEVKELRDMVQQLLSQQPQPQQQQQQVKQRKILATTTQPNVRLPGTGAIQFGDDNQGGMRIEYDDTVSTGRNAIINSSSGVLVGGVLLKDGLVNGVNVSTLDAEGSVVSTDVSTLLDRVTPCHSSPCASGNTCAFSALDVYVCNDIDDCSPNPCSGLTPVCVDTGANSYTCVAAGSCPPSMTAYTCSPQEDICTTNACDVCCRYDVASDDSLFYNPAIADGAFVFGTDTSGEFVQMQSPGNLNRGMRKMNPFHGDFYVEFVLGCDGCSVLKVAWGLIGSPDNLVTVDAGIDGATFAGTCSTLTGDFCMQHEDMRDSGVYAVNGGYVADGTRVGVSRVNGVISQFFDGALHHTFATTDDDDIWFLYGSSNAGASTLFGVHDMWWVEPYCGSAYAGTASDCSEFGAIGASPGRRCCTAKPLDASDWTCSHAACGTMTYKGDTITHNNNEDRTFRSAVPPLVGDFLVSYTVSGTIYPQLGVFDEAYVADYDAAATGLAQSGGAGNFAFHRARSNAQYDGSNIQALTTVSIGDVVDIRRVGTTITTYLNGALEYTYGQAATTGDFHVFMSHGNAAGVHGWTNLQFVSIENF